MKQEMKTAKELYHHYRIQYNNLINTYCQAKENHPLDRYPELARAIWRTGRCMEIWYCVALRLAQQKFFGGG